MRTNPRPVRRAVTRVAIVAVLAMSALSVATSAASAATFDPELVISDDNMRHYDSMSAKEIQAFLETQTGPLATLVTSDYDKVITLSKTKNNVNTTPDKGETPKPASQIIWEACQAWKISPKVMLTMLQKEQSLITTMPRPGSSTLARAVGAGCPGSLVDPANNPVATNRYPGFGNQIWHGARLLSSYGEGHIAFPTYYPGIAKTIYRDAKYGTHLHPKNLATFKLYVYNPSIPGNTNFYNIYGRFFGSPLAHPRLRTVYRFRSHANGTYLYTASIIERHRLRNYPTRWVYGGASFSWDTSVTASATKPVWRFYNRDTHKYSFTASTKTYNARRSAAGRRTWAYSGVAWRVSSPTAYTKGSQRVYRFQNRSDGGMLLTASTSQVAKLRKTPYSSRWRYLGTAYYMPRYQAAETSPTP